MALKGIDVSSYQKDLNVAAYPCDFVICKATEGTGYVNPVCDKHYQEAKSSGKLLGVYHYARPDTGNSAESEADYFLDNIKGYIGEAVLALDLECQNWCGYVTWSKNFLDRVYAKTGIRPLFYSPGAGFENFKDMLNMGNYGVWACSADHYYDGATIVMKQSVYDNLDHDTFYGDAAAWRKYANQSGFVTPASPAPEIPTGIGYKVGDTVKVINAVTYDGKPFKTWFSKYKVMEVSGDRIVIGVNGVVTAAINAANIAYAASPAQEIPTGIGYKVGDTVKVINAVTYDGKPFKTWFSTYKVMEVSGDRIVIGVNGVVTAAINSKNIMHA